MDAESESDPDPALEQRQIKQDKMSTAMAVAWQGEKTCEMIAQSSMWRAWRGILNAEWTGKRNSGSDFMLNCL